MTFEKYNANPENKNIGDCSIRAICTATPLTYQQAKKLLETKVFESGAAWNTVKNITAALADLGIEVKAASRETVNSFTKHCDTGASYVVFVAKHAVAVVNGVIYDTWDSSRRFVKLVAKVISYDIDKREHVHTSFTVGPWDRPGGDWNNRILNGDYMRDELQRLEKQASGKSPAEIISDAEAAAAAWQMLKKQQAAYQENICILRRMLSVVTFDDWNDWKVNAY